LKGHPPSEQQMSIATSISACDLFASARRKNSREHEKPALSRWLIGFGGIPGAASRIPHAALVPPLLFANRNQFICVIDGAS
jgi:hypothetical protein